jgi:dipeptidyl aminopeptidase/acylaminoacyl peptidase
VCARFDPAGGNVLLVVKQQNPAQFSEGFRFDLMPLKGGDVRTIHTAMKACNVQFAPDGSKLAVVEFASNDYSGKKPKIQIVDVKTGEARLLLDMAGPIVRWFKDSKRLLTFQIRDDKSSEFHGDIVDVDVASGKVTTLAAAIGRNESCLDLSPDNETVAFTADKAGAAGAQLVPGKSSQTYLFELEIATGKIRESKTPAKFVRYSPGGKKLLVTNQPLEFLLSNKQQLVVVSSGLTKFDAIAKDAYTPAIAVGLDYVALPGWIDDDHLFYFTERMVYGTTGKALHLVLIDADGSHKRFVQPDIDLALEKLNDAGK